MIESQQIKTSGLPIQYTIAPENPFYCLETEFLAEGLFNKMLHTHLSALSFTCKGFYAIIKNDTALKTYCLSVKEFKLNINVILENVETDRERAQAIANLAISLGTEYTQEISLLIQKTFNLSHLDFIEKWHFFIRTIIPILDIVCPEGIVNLAVFNGFAPLPIIEVVTTSLINKNFKRAIKFLDQCNIKNMDKYAILSKIYLNDHHDLIIVTIPDNLALEEYTDLMMNFIHKNYRDENEFSCGAHFGDAWLCFLAQEVMKTDLKLAEKIVRSLGQSCPKHNVVNKLTLAMREIDFKNTINFLFETKISDNPRYNQKWKAETLKNIISKYERIYIPPKMSFKEYANLLLECIDNVSKKTESFTNIHLELKHDLIRINILKDCKEILRTMYDCFLIQAPEESEKIALVLSSYEKEYLELNSNLRIKDIL